MTNRSRRVVLFAAAIVGGLGLLTVLLLVAQAPRRRSSLLSSITPTPRLVATVDEEPVFFDEWKEAVALDWVMSGLIGQASPSSEDTLNRLINERLVLQAAGRAGIPEVDESQAEVWLASFLASWNVDEVILDQALAGVGLTHSDLIGEIVPRLLRVERALEELPSEGKSESWVADLRRQAKVVVLENLSAPPSLGVPAPTAVQVTPSVQSSLASTPFPVGPSSGPRVGELAPEFSLQMIGGPTMRLSELRGQPVLLNFWAPWCPPCREELPMLQAAYSENLVVLGIAVRAPSDTVMDFAADLGLELPLLLDQDGRASDAYQVRGLPTSLFVDGRGLVVARHVGPLGPETLDVYLASLLDLPPTPTPVP